MKAKVGYTITIIALVGVLGTLLWFLLGAGIAPAAEEANIPTLPTSAVGKGTIVDKVSGAAEVKPSKTENLKMDKYTAFQAFVAPFDVKIPAGTPLVEYTNGKALIAPYDLVVRSKNLPEKKWDTLGEEHYVEVSRVDLLNVDIDVGEADISRLAVGQRAEVTLGADESKVLEGTITKINEIGTYNATGSKYRVTIEVINDGSVLVGMSANVSIVVGEAVDVLTVPVSAIVDTPEGPMLTKVDAEGNNSMVPVETGLSDGTMVEVRGDISEGDIVVVNEVSSSPGGMPAGSAGLSTFSVG